MPSYDGFQKPGFRLVVTHADTPIQPRLKEQRDRLDSDRNGLAIGVDGEKADIEQGLRR